MTPDRQTELLLWTVAAAAGIGWWVTTKRVFVREILGVWGLAFVVVVLTGVLVSGLHRNHVWQVWGLVWAVGLGLNLVLFRRTPQALVREPLVELGYLYPWFLLLGGGYLFTAVYDRGNAALTVTDRAVALGAGIASLGLFVAFWTSRPVDPVRLVRVLGVLSVVPTTSLAVSVRRRSS